jgi:hypothetical protein
VLGTVLTAGILLVLVQTLTRGKWASECCADPARAAARRCP